MNTRILKAIDEVKVMLDTYTFQRDTTRIKEILYSLQDEDNYDELLVEVNDIGNRYALEDKFDNTHHICWMIDFIIQAILNPCERKIWHMEHDIKLRKISYFPNLE